MIKTNLDIMENKIILNTMKFYTEINVKNSGGMVFFQLKIVNNNMEETLLNFSTLEDAIKFVENVVKKSNSIEEIIKKYFDVFKNSITEEVEDIPEIDLSVSQVKEAIIDYYGNDKDHALYAFENVYMRGGEAQVDFYLNEHVSKGNAYNTKISQEELGFILQMYAAKKGYELLDFKYIGGVHRVGYFFDEDTPYLQGIRLYVKKLEKNMELKKENHGSKENI